MAGYVPGLKRFLILMEVIVCLLYIFSVLSSYTGYRVELMYTAASHHYADLLCDFGFKVFLIDLVLTFVVMVMFPFVSRPKQGLPWLERYVPLVLLWMAAFAFVMLDRITIWMV